MIQRIQTIYLFLAAVVLLLLFVFPLGIVGGNNFTFQNDIVAFIAALVGAGVSLITIFLFRNRSLQKKTLQIAVFAVSFFVGWIAMSIFINKDPALDQFGIGLACPFIALLFMFLAMRGINKDNKIVKSMDRLR